MGPLTVFGAWLPRPSSARTRTVPERRYCRNSQLRRCQFLHCTGR